MLRIPYNTTVECHVSASGNVTQSHFADSAQHWSGQHLPRQQRPLPQLVADSADTRDVGVRVHMAQRAPAVHAHDAVPHRYQEYLQGVREHRRNTSHRPEEGACLCYFALSRPIYRRTAGHCSSTAIIVARLLDSPRIHIQCQATKFKYNNDERSYGSSPEVRVAACMHISHVCRL